MNEYSYSYGESEPHTNMGSKTQCANHDSYNEQNNEFTDNELFEQQSVEKSERSFGLVVADTIIYPFVNNMLVTGISIGATFLTQHGAEIGQNIKSNHHNAIGNTVGGFCEWMEDRGKSFENLLDNMGMKNQLSKETTRTVAFSFIDGCAVTPLVEVLERNKKNIAFNIDKIAGTVPIDQSIYDKEPSRDLKAIIGGRAMTAAVVVPVAMMLENKWGSEKSLNERLFYDNGKKLGNLFKDKLPDIAENFKEEHIQTVARVSLFEIFYTSVCTAGLYASSNYLANKFNEKQEDKINSKSDISQSGSYEEAENYLQEFINARNKIFNNNETYIGKMQPERTTELARIY